MIKVAYGGKEAKTLIKKAMFNAWQKEWATDNKGRHYYNLQKSVHVRCVTGRYQNVREEVIITQLRLDHAGFQSMLYIMGKSLTNLCLCHNTHEDVEHIIIYCRKYNSREGDKR